MYGLIFFYTFNLESNCIFHKLYITESYLIPSDLLLLALEYLEKGQLFIPSKQLKKKKECHFLIQLQRLFLFWFIFVKHTKLTILTTFMYIIHGSKYTYNVVQPSPLSISRTSHHEQKTLSMQH